jgi:SAM-dependent methyltransferase
MSDPYSGLTNMTSSGFPHLGGNISEGDPFTFCPTVWTYVVHRFGVRRVLDLGAGNGYASRFFHQIGMEVLAVEGMAENVKNSVFPSVQIDLTEGSVCCDVDLVYCQEVVEHIEERFLENLLNSLSCGRFILMTHASPGQGGYHHVNEQPSEYWIEHLNARGYRLMEEDTKRIRALAKTDGAIYMADTGLLLCR